MPKGPEHSPDVVGSSQDAEFSGVGPEIHGLDQLENLHPDSEKMTLTDDEIQILANEYKEIAQKYETPEEWQDALAHFAIQKYGISKPQDVFDIAEDFAKRNKLIIENTNTAEGAFAFFRASEGSNFEPHRMALLQILEGLERLEEKAEPAVVEGSAEDVPEGETAWHEQPVEVAPEPENSESSENQTETRQEQVERINNGVLEELVEKGLEGITATADWKEKAELMNRLRELFKEKTSQIKPEDDPDGVLITLRGLLGVEATPDANPPGGADLVAPDKSTTASDLGEKRAAARDAFLHKEEKVQEAVEAGEKHLAELLERARKSIEGLAGEADESLILQKIQEIISMDQKVRSEAEVLAKENDDSMKGRFVKAWRSNKGAKARIAVGIVLVAATGGLGALGYGGLAAIPAAARGILSGVSAYTSAKAGQERAAGWINRKFHKDNLGSVTQAEAAELSEAELQARLASVESPSVTAGRSSKQEQADILARGSLLAAQSEILRKKFESATDSDLVERAMKVLETHMKEQLSAENDRLVHDQKANNRRRFVAGTIAVAAAASAFASGIDRAGGGGAPDSSPAGAEQAPAGPVEINDSGGTEYGGTMDATAQEAFFDDYPDVVVDPDADGSDSRNVVARKHLQNIPGWNSFTDAEKNTKISHLANQLTKNNEGHWRYTKEIIKTAYNK